MTPFIFLGGILHFGILIASAVVPQVLDWRRELAKLSPLTRQLIWVHGLFIVLTIIGFGALATLYPAPLASGSPLARAVCTLIALFWAVRLVIQFTVFDARPYLTHRWLKIGYHGLTVVFLSLAVIFAAAGLG